MVLVLNLGLKLHCFPLKCKKKLYRSSKRLSKSSAHIFKQVNKFSGMSHFYNSYNDNLVNDPDYLTKEGDNEFKSSVIISFSVPIEGSITFSPFDNFLCFKFKEHFKAVLSKSSQVES